MPAGDQFEKCGGLYLPTSSAPSSAPTSAPAPECSDPDLFHEPKDDGEECTVGHYDESPGGCQRCRWCKEYVRPHHMNRRCTARPKADPGAGI